MNDNRYYEAGHEWTLTVVFPKGKRKNDFVKSLEDLTFYDYEDCSSLARLLKRDFPLCDVRIYRRESLI